MNITCNAAEYTIEEREDMIVVSNKLYEANSLALLVTAILEMFVPDQSTYKVPKSIIIPKSNDSIIEIDKNLNVKGTEDYEYVLIEKQYNNWKKSYLITNISTVLITLLLFVFLSYIAIIEIKNLLMLIPAIIVLFLSLILSKRLFKQLHIAKNMRKIIL